MPFFMKNNDKPLTECTKDPNKVPKSVPLPITAHKKETEKK